MKALSPITPMLLAVVALGALFSTAPVHAQAQSLLSSNQVVISRVEPLVPQDSLLISGINFPTKATSTPVVSVILPGDTVVRPLTSSYNAATRQITALLPTGTMAADPGSYRLMVSFGPGTAATDVFEFTIGAVGPVGPQGIQGVQGIQGSQGPQGVKGDTGLQGAKGETGPQGIPGPQGPIGLTGSQGPQGVAGTDGRSVWNGTGAPDRTIGADGDFYLDTSATVLYGPKMAGAWSAGVALVGPAGAQGPAGPKGSTGPAWDPSTLPQFQNKPAAIAAGLPYGSLWVQSDSGVVRMLLNNGNSN